MFVGNIAEYLVEVEGVGEWLMDSPNSTPTGLSRPDDTVRLNPSPHALYGLGHKILIGSLRVPRPGPSRRVAPDQPRAQYLACRSRRCRLGCGQPVYGTFGHVVDRLTKGGQRVALPAGLSDVVETDARVRHRNADAGAVASGIHQAACEQIRRAECGWPRNARKVGHVTGDDQ